MPLLALLLLFCVAIFWPLTLVASRLISLCSRLLLLNERLCKSVPIALSALSRLLQTLRIELRWAQHPRQSTYGEKFMYVPVWMKVKWDGIIR